MNKPFSFDELLAHIRPLMRRYGSVKQAVPEHAGICIDLIGHSVKAQGMTVRSGAQSGFSPNSKANMED